MLTFRGADLVGYSIAQHLLLLVVQGEDPLHAQLLRGWHGPAGTGVWAVLEGDVLVQSVGEGLVVMPKEEGIFPVRHGGYGCGRAARRWSEDAFALPEATAKGYRQGSRTRWAGRVPNTDGNSPRQQAAVVTPL